MQEVLVEEVTHDGDFAEHLNMHRTKTFRGNRGEHSFTHWYAKSPIKSKKHPSDESLDTFHGIMAYHGYKQKKTRDPASVEYEGSDKHRNHKFKAHLNKNGHVVAIHHHEDFKAVNEDTKTKPFKKTLRQVIGKQAGPDMDSALDSHPAPSQKAAEKKFIDASGKTVKYTGYNGEPDDYAAPVKQAKHPGPDVGLKAPPVSIKERHSVEHYDAQERESKAKWHYDRVGKHKNASFKKGIENDYQAQLLKRGVKDSNGNQLPLRKEEVEIDEAFVKGYKKGDGYDGRRTKAQEALGKHISKSLGSNKATVEHHEKGGLRIFSKGYGKPGNNKHVREMSKHLDAQGIPHRYEETQGWGRHRDHLYVQSDHAHDHGEKHLAAKAQSAHAADRDRLIQHNESVEIAETRSDSYQFSTNANDKDGERRIKRLKDVVHAFAPGKFQVRARGRLGKDNPNAQKYRDRQKTRKEKGEYYGVHGHFEIDKKDTNKHDVYLQHRRNEEFELDEAKHTHLVHVEYDHPEKKGRTTAYVKVHDMGMGPTEARKRAIQRLRSSGHDSSYANAKAGKVSKIIHESEDEFIVEDVKD